jgi:predicted helicase
VQILDPATGTGTFLVEAIDVIHRSMEARWKRQGHMPLEFQRLWNEYVPKHLLPRLHGFELMMAPYAIAHMKIGLKLYETGYRFGSTERARVYLTNSLEPPRQFKKQSEFEEWSPALAHEAKAVNEIKVGQRFTVIIGNPPYSGISSNRNEWIDGLLRGEVPHEQNKVANYYEIEGRSLGEKKLWLQDDYVKFMRLSHFLLETSSVGIHGMITNHSYVDSPTCRGMRSQMLKFYSSLNFIDLHGSTKKGEEAPSGVYDENVFDILPGVAIGVCARTGSVERASVRTFDLWGTRAFKFDWLVTKKLGNVEWSDLAPAEPTFLFVKRELQFDNEYRTYFGLKEIFPFYGTAIQTSRDDFAIDRDRNALEERLRIFFDLRNPDHQIEKEFGLSDTRGWKLKDVRRSANLGLVKKSITRFLFRTFDLRWIALTKDIVDWPRLDVMSCIAANRLGLLCSRQQSTSGFRHALVVNAPVDMFCISNKSREGQTLFPLFIRNEDGLFHENGQTQWRPNVGKGFVEEMNRILERSDRPEMLSEDQTNEALNYVYSILYSPSYRSRYADLLKMDYPRVPLSTTPQLFRKLATLGGELVKLHLLESPEIDHHLDAFTGPANPEVEKVTYSNKTVWLDKKQTHGFLGVPEQVWHFEIGGYQVCEKWLKDRKGCKLSTTDIAHYNKILAAVRETVRVMDEIDKVIENNGGWPKAFAQASP